MIRFTCDRCGRAVRVPDASAGRKGRCPFCKQVVAIPAPGQPPEETEVADLAAALAGEKPRREAGSPAVPAPSLQDVDVEPELERAGDLSHKTDRLDTVGDGVLVEAAEEQEPPEGAGDFEAAFTEAMGKTKRALPRAVLIGGGTGLVVLIAAAVMLLTWRPWDRSAPTEKPPRLQAALVPARPTTPQPAPPTPLPRPEPIPTQPAQTFALSAEIAAAVGKAPAGTFAMFCVDFERSAQALAEVPTRASEIVEAVAGSELWTNAAERIAQGALPRSAALYLSGTGEPVAAMFGKFYPAKPSAGLWALAKSDAAVPHFLVRLTGPAAGNYTNILIARADAMGLGQTFRADKVATHARLRMVPASAPSMDKAGEMLIGTVETIDDAGNCPSSPELHERLRRLLKKVPTNRPVVGCVRLDVAADCLSKVTGAEEAPPAWAGKATVLVFSVDPRPKGKADLVLCNAPTEGFRAVQSLVMPMVTVGENGDVRISGRGTYGLGALGNLLPGFRELAVKVLAMAKPPQPSPQPTPAPTAPTPPRPTIQPEGEPAPPRKVPFLCLNPQCSTRGTMFEVPDNQVSADVLAGHAALTCPHCGKNTAAIAVKCPHCQTWYVKNLDLCPNPRCNKPRE